IKGAISGVGRLIQSYLNYKHTLGQEESISYETNITDCQNILSPTIVVVIGESFSKHHSSLYNYPKETNPKLEEVRLSSNLYVFDDVICPYNITNKMLKAILSMHSVDSQEEWNNFPIWPHIFRDAGYFVSFISNQITKFNDDGNAGDGLGSYFFQHPDVVSHSFDYRNTYKYKYDLEFLSEIDKYTIPSDKNELQIIQLHGQHVRARYRFPLEYEYFKVSDYTHSNYFQTTDSQKQEIADYDNATRYNDYVLSKIIERYQDKEAIIFYFSDHGEEVYDYREVIGRSQSETKTANEMKYQYEIPFMIYVSQKYKERNKEIVCQIEQAIHKPFMSDDIGHILLGVSGIKCQWYNPQRDLLSPLYNEKRIRMIEGSQVYRKHME
ncbi:MAG: phosphoethanolamine transferase, partial [Alistipes sp.]|nr:phosphoethanolamine transferase [Alistipes sp.]